MPKKIIKFKQAIQDINFSYLDDINHFSQEELNDIICLKIDLLFKQYFPKLEKESHKGAIK